MPEESPATRRRSRSRSRSPPNRDRSSSDRPPRKPRSSGFGWKDKSRGSTSYADARGDRRGGLERGYRQRRSPSPGPRRHDSDSRDDREHRDRDYDRPRDRHRERDRDRPHSDRDRDSRDDGDRKSKPPRRDKKPAAPTPAAGPAGGEEMIIVHVNDRLGTKAAIPCFASDRVREFKILVAARIGREPHEILLKRQGERPFKDQLSLEDYGVSNGVQIDLEVDTGD
ncbi:hypothetical protein BROUX41_005302 [Berkeleyomyces rouxiae]|uniref:uncharacterized protein n=1 Tax=Berkeleyomyces rouxiae TaxID=2035830 RepID=UPI003B80CB73